MAYPEAGRGGNRSGVQEATDADSNLTMQKCIVVALTGAACDVAVAVALRFDSMSRLFTVLVARTRL